MAITFSSSGNSGGIASTVDLSRYSLASNLNENVLTFQKFGSNPQIGAGGVEDIWDASGDYVYPTTATLASIVSSSTQDNPSGSGIGMISIQGLNENWDLVTENINLNGTTPVTSINAYIRVFRLRALSGGSLSGVNSGAGGVISASVDGVVVAQIDSGNTTTNMTMITVPNGYTGFINNLASSGGPNDDFIVYFQVRGFGSNIFATTANFEVSNSNTVNFEFDPSGGNIPEKSDMKFRVEAVSNNTQVRVLYTVVFVKNEYLQKLAANL